MSVLGVQFEPTRIAGTLAFGTAALACLHAAAATPRRRTVWWTLGAVQLLCLFEILVGLRFGLHEAFNGLLREHGWYESRGQWQAGVLAVALLPVAAIAARAAWRHRDDGATVAAVVGTGFAVALLAAETVSLHRIDAAMYARAGPILVLAWLWIGAATLVIAAALARRP